MCPSVLFATFWSRENDVSNVSTDLFPLEGLQAGHKPDGVLQRVAHGQGQPLEDLLRVVRQDDDVGDAISVQDRTPQVLQPVVQQRGQH